MPFNPLLVQDTLTVYKNKGSPWPLSMNSHTVDKQSNGKNYLCGSPSEIHFFPLERGMRNL